MKWERDTTLFLAITFGIAWSIVALVLGFPDWFVAQFGPMTSASPLFYIAVWSPNIAALALTIARGGWPAFKDLLAHLFRWRAAPWVWVAAIAFYPALMIVVQLVGLAFGRPLVGADAWAMAASGLLSLPALALGPLGEELGWRGYLLPRMLERMSPFVAALVVGAIWMIWHIPAFLVSGLPQGGMSFPIFALSGVALSVFVTWLFVNARQSILVAGIIPHAIANAYGEATGAMTWIQAGVLVAGALLLVVLIGTHLGGRGRDRACPTEPDLHLGGKPGIDVDEGAPQRSLAERDRLNPQRLPSASPPRTLIKLRRGLRAPASSRASKHKPRTLR